MGMIAFYAGLFVGILFGFLFSSLWAFSLARRKAGALPDQAEDYPRQISWSLEAGRPPSQVFTRFRLGPGMAVPEPGPSIPE